MHGLMGSGTLFCSQLMHVPDTMEEDVDAGGGPLIPAAVRTFIWRCTVLSTIFRIASTEILANSLVRLVPVPDGPLMPMVGSATRSGSGVGSDMILTRVN